MAKQAPDIYRGLFKTLTMFNKNSEKIFILESDIETLCKSMINYQNNDKPVILRIEGKMQDAEMLDPFILKSGVLPRWMAHQILHCIDEIDELKK
jgi:hypothetical protein